MNDHEISYQTWYMMERGHADPCPEQVVDPHPVASVGCTDVCHCAAHAPSVVAEKELPFTVVED